ncbi:anhydro-N-acetylmuramic acid kinase [Phytohalomonas tamaricis]|uniref:anhydro-N-acetylmuramic acid kinase n=1 Tax=Phytohalomonas tamaricis TaxID=2081032 RepID=UPI000D0B3B07|nr:anhydro-N-acetylmuramic acid kinase [Phytohalomonas tamaricis]
MPLFIGLMSGTSLDGIDAALVRCEHGHRPKLLNALGIVMPSRLRQTLLSISHADSVRFDTLAQAEHDFCHLQAEAVNQLLAQTGLTPKAVAAIGSHGQTIEHRPYDTPAYTCQLDNPSLLAELTQCTIVGDFRRRDLAAGGQGAPLAPGFHVELFQDDREWRVALNLGGFANLTLLPPHTTHSPIIGFDTGPANALLDGWYSRHHEGHFDADGHWASTGRVNEQLLMQMMAEPFFRLPPPKSTGRETFNMPWLERQLAGYDASPVDVQATLAELTAASVAMGARQTLPSDVNMENVKVIPCGGGAHNLDLQKRIAQRLSPMHLVACDSFGWSPDWLEAGAFAWLAWRRLEQRPGNIATVTGATGPRMLGGVYSP